MNDSYQTIVEPVCEEIKVKGSRFIGDTAQVRSVDEAQQMLNKVRKREHAATHHCFAYHVGVSSDIFFKYSDDGEPNGTAGKPIYDCITGRKLTNLIVVVNRYFGGTKLGTGGLVRAYSEAATAALNKSGFKTGYLTDIIKLTIDFSYYDQLLKLLQNYEVGKFESEFAEQVKLTVAIRKSKMKQFVHDIIELSGGKAHIEPE